MRVVFGLHCATPDMQLTGIEIASEAIACAKQSAAELGLTRLQFQALDSTEFATAQGEVPELVLVNPPRRGIGKPLCDYLSTMAPRFIIYSSCNAQTMAKISANCQVTASNGYSFLICSRTPRTMKC